MRGYAADIPWALHLVLAANRHNIAESQFKFEGAYDALRRFRRLLRFAVVDC